MGRVRIKSEFLIECEDRDELNDVIDSLDLCDGVLNGTHKIVSEEFDDE